MVQDLPESTLYWLLVAAIWPVLTAAAYWLLLKVFNHLRWAEVFRLVIGRGTTVFVLLAAAVFVETLAATSTGFARGAWIAVGFLSKLGVGLALWIGAIPVIDTFEKEFAERLFAAHGRHKQRNVSAILFHLAKPLVVVAIVLVMGRLFRFDLTDYLVTFGGVGVAVAFSLQSVLTNVFSGLSLALDTPFTRNDLIRVGTGGEIYDILKRGLRVTTARNIASHETVFLPNKLLTDEILTDITRPTDDLRAIIDIGVPYSADLRQVRSILVDIANGHPHVVGGFAAKRKAIAAKVARLYIRQVFADCRVHFVEFARLAGEESLNARLEAFHERIGDWADFVDQSEERGFDPEERRWLAMIGEELEETTIEVANLTTEWQLLFRNCVGRGANIPVWSERRVGPGWSPSPDVVAQMLDRLFADSSTPRAAGGDGATIAGKMDWLAVHLDLLSKNAAGYLATALPAEGLANDPRNQIFDVIYPPTKLGRDRLNRLETGVGDLHVTHQECTYAPGTNADRTAWTFPGETRETAYQYIQYALAAAEELSRIANIPPEGPDNSAEYRAAQMALDSVQRVYFDLGVAYSEILRDAARWIVREERIARPYVRRAQTEEFRDWFGHHEGESGFNIVLCRNRQEALYISRRAGDQILKHPLCSALAGMILDEDERHDLFSILQVWGDKVYELMTRARRIRRELKRARSTTIDTQLHDLADWLKGEFKDPNPSWKYPIAPMEGFDDSSIHMTVKLYIDNVRMERYLRPANTFTQIRLRIFERLLNAGIIIPFPQRDLHLKTPTAIRVDLTGPAPAAADQQPE